MPSPWPHPSMTERVESSERFLPVSEDHKTLRVLAWPDQGDTRAGCIQRPWDQPLTRHPQCSGSAPEKSSTAHSRCYAASYDSNSWVDFASNDSNRPAWSALNVLELRHVALCCTTASAQ
jgi:hypothetical protein